MPIPQPLPARFTIGVAAVIFLAIAAPSRAAFVFSLTEVGSDVQITGSGSLNLSALTVGSAGPSSPAFTVPSEAFLSAGGGQAAGSFSGITGPASFGVGPFSGFAGVTAGQPVAIDGSRGTIQVPFSYVSDAALTNSATFQNQTFASLGLSPGSYVYTWGSGGSADSLTINIVPEPSTLVLSIVGLVGALVLLKRRKGSVPASR